MKKIEKQRLYLYELVHLIKALYPHQKTKHNFKTELIDLADVYTPSELLILDDLISCLTLLNQADRQQCNQQFLSTLSDLENAKRLFLPKEYQLTAIDLKDLLTLKENFNTKSFTYLEAEVKLNRSYSHIKRLVRKLKANNLIYKINKKSNNKRALYQLKLENYTPITLQEEEQEESIFEIMQEDWQNMHTYIDLKHRT
jgi:predicted transcriptional regulator